jgi:hypothetical protein
MTHEDALLIIKALVGIQASISTIALFYVLSTLFKKMNSGYEIDKLNDTIEKLIRQIARGM